MKKLTLRLWAIILLSGCFALIPSQGNAINLYENDLLQTGKFDTAEVLAPNAADIWIALRDSGKLAVDEGGYFYVEDNEYSSCSTYAEFLTVLQHCNLFISRGIISATEANSVRIMQDSRPLCEEQIFAYEVADGVVNLNGAKEEVSVDPNGGTGSNHDYIIFDGGDGHICAVMSIDLIGICEQNYISIQEYHESMLVMQQTEPTFNAILATSLFWVSQVCPNGPWDYKVSTTYGPHNKMLCSYYNGAYHHFTAEYFGNLNYGYTGSYLFTLDTLHWGSSAVSGFDPADEADWPAIDEGFYLKRGN
jgi:hypothetical protein